MERQSHYVPCLGESYVLQKCSLCHQLKLRSCKNQELKLKLLFMEKALQLTLVPVLLQELLTSKGVE